MSEGSSNSKNKRVLRSTKRPEDSTPSPAKAEVTDHGDLKNVPDSPRKRKRTTPEDGKSNSELEELPQKKGKGEKSLDEKQNSDMKESEPSLEKKEADLRTETNSPSASLLGIAAEPQSGKKEESERSVDPEFIDNLYLLRNSISLVLSKTHGTKGKEITDAEAWGQLVSSQDDSSVPLSGSVFSIGRSTGCNYIIPDMQIPSILLKFHHSAKGVTLENVTTSNALFVNSLQVRKGSKVKLQDGDEISLIGSKAYNFLLHYSESHSRKDGGDLSSLDSLEGVEGGGPTTPTGYMTRSRRKTPVFTSQAPSNKNDNSMEISEKIPEELTEELEKLKKNSMEKFESQILEPQNIEISFDNFPSQLNDTLKNMLISTSYVYLEKPSCASYLSSLPLSRRVLLSGPPGSEFYQLNLMKSVAKHFQAHLLVLDSSHFEFEAFLEKKKSEEKKDKHKKIDKKHLAITRLLRQSLKEKTSTFPPIRRIRLGDEDPFSLEGEIKEEDKLLGTSVGSLFEVLKKVKHPIIVFAPEAETTLTSSHEKYSLFKKEFSKVGNDESLLFVGGTTVPVEKKEKSSSPQSKVHAIFDVAFLSDHLKSDEKNFPLPPGLSSLSSGLSSGGTHSRRAAKLLLKLLPNQIPILPPTDPKLVADWTTLLKDDTERLKVLKNKENFRKVLQKNQLGWEGEQFEDPEMRSQILPMDVVEKIVGWGVTHRLTLPGVPTNPKETLTLSAPCLAYGLKLHLGLQPAGLEKTLKDVECENEFEKKLLGEVIPPSELDVSFEDIGALDQVKQTLRELVMVPLQRPELFTKGALTRPCKGILLFGPPGTGKTMLAKAVASQSGANFINVSMSTIASKWFGEGEKYVKGLFTLASKIAPTVIFVDEVDSILGRRERHGEHEAMRKIKNEFMSNWDGLKTKSSERVLVLGATNRPFDLDEAVLRRLSRRLLIDLPDQENRKKILQVVLAKEELDSTFDMEELAQKTDGFSGSDLKNLCTAAAYQPIRQILEEEKKEMEASGASAHPKKGPVEVRALSKADFDKSLEEISASVSEDAVSITELRKWNELYGEGGNRKKESLPYFL